jgi:hypothetical protein
MSMFRVGFADCSGIHFLICFDSIMLSRYLYSSGGVDFLDLDDNGSAAPKEDSSLLFLNIMLDPFDPF